MERKGTPCSCARPLAPPHTQCGYLMHRIIGQGRLHDGCRDVCICLDTIPCGACPPFCLEHITSCDCYTCRVDHPRSCIIVTATLQCSIRDGHGCVFSAKATLDFPLPIRHIAEHNRAACTCIASGTVRLNQCAQSNNACFHSSVDVCLDAYVTTPEVLLQKACPVPCPPMLPWYPQPNKTCP